MIKEFNFERSLMDANQQFNKLYENQKKMQEQKAKKPKKLSELISQQRLTQIDYESDETINYILSGIPESIYDEKLFQETEKLKVRYISVQRKNKLFAGFLQGQRKYFQNKMRNVQLRPNIVPQTFRGREQLKIQNHDGSQSQWLQINNEDLSKLNPYVDINDNIIQNYFKILKLFVIPSQILQKTFFFSTFFMGKLMGQLINKQQILIGKQPQKKSFQQTKKKIKENYINVKKWYRKVNLFKFDYLVIPVNSNNHWNCLIVVHPNSLQNQISDCHIIGMDSMFQIKQVFYDALKVYLQLEILQKNNRQIKSQEINSYQIILPRQINHHDCGLYVMCYVQMLFSKSENLNKLQDIQKRNFLELFSREIVQTMRTQLKNLLFNIMKGQTNQQKIDSVQQFLKYRNQMIERCCPADFDTIDGKYFEKYCRLSSNYIEQQKQNQYKLMLKFYLDGDINYYQQDEF